MIMDASRFSSADAGAADSLVANVTDDFLQRVELGEEPNVESYASQHPEIADLLRELLPAVRCMRRTEFGGAPAPLTHGPTPAEVDGELGDYRLVREIGRGGMGIVYEAQQISLRRRVALKVLPFAAALDERRLERFKTEAQAAAQLHHSNIVPVYSVGCERGVWYYAMQVIDGESLADVVDQLRQASPDGRVQSAPRSRSNRRSQAPTGIERLQSESSVHGGTAPSANTHGVPIRPDAGEERVQVQANQGASPSSSGCNRESRIRSGLAVPASTHDSTYIRTVAELGVQAADALEYAHSVGIVHRDIKPGNLLVDFRGNLWVTDFGLVRFGDESRLTFTGDLVGTLAYMSPEQASGRRGAVDHRTDIYSLGATLYELLTLEPAFHDESRADLLRRIASDDPPAPRRRNPRIPVDFETIILKTMSRDCLDRYQTAGELADDLRRFLDSRPIQARRPGWLELAAKWARRHRSLVAGALAVLLLLVVGLGFSTALIAREQIKTRHAYEEVSLRQAETQVALRSEARQRRLAEQNFQQARGMLGMMIQVVEEDLASGDTPHDVRSRLLQESLNYYREFVEQAGEDASLQRELGSSQLRTVRTLHDIGSTPDAVEQALTIQEQLVRDHPDNMNHRWWLCLMYSELGTYRRQEPIHLAGDRAVQRHLGMTSEQIGVCDRLAWSYRQVSRGFARGHDPTDKRIRLGEEMDYGLAELTCILTPAQFRRLKQIALQKRGIYGYKDRDVALALQLTRSQLSEIRAICAAAGREVRSRFRGGGYEDIERINQQSRDQLQALLDDSQRRKWTELVGATYEFGSRRYRGRSQ